MWGGGEAPCCVRASRAVVCTPAAARAAPAAAATAARPRLAPQDAIGEAKSLRLKDGARLERDVLVFRSLLGLRNFAPVLSGIPAPGADKATEPCLRAVRLLACYMAAAPGAAGAAARAEAVAGVDAALADGGSAGDATVQAVAALVHCAAGNLPAALRALRSPQGIEHLALLAQLQLRIDRPDLAERTVKAMQALDDEAALTTLSTAQLCLALVRLRARARARVIVGEEAVVQRRRTLLLRRTARPHFSGPFSPSPPP
jgi:hypothetical protein